MKSDVLVVMEFNRNFVLSGSWNFIHNLHSCNKKTKGIYFLNYFNRKTSGIRRYCINSNYNSLLLLNTCCCCIVTWRNCRQYFMKWVEWNNTSACSFGFSGRIAYLLTTKLTMIAEQYPQYSYFSSAHSIFFSEIVSTWFFI